MPKHHLLLPSTLIILLISERRTDVHFASIIMYRGNQAHPITVNIEDSKFSYLIRSGKRRSQFGK